MAHEVSNDTNTSSWGSTFRINPGKNMQEMMVGAGQDETVSSLDN